MNNVGGSLSEMFASSMVVLRQPSVATFERFERRGNLQSALMYVAVAAVITGLVGLLPTFSVGGFVRGILQTLIGFFIFTYATFFIGQRQGGTGTLDEVAYTFSLFYVPLQVIGSIITLIVVIFAFIPFVNLLVGIIALLVALALVVVQVYLGYLAVQSSMNLRGQPALITLIVAALITFIVSLVLGSIGLV